MKKIDCITFATGMDVLKIRLAELVPHVDWFVLVESTHNFAGIPKPLHWQENPITGYKVKHVVIEPTHVAGSSPLPDWLAWNNMSQQVELGFSEGTKDFDASDMGYFSDFDEIPRPSKLLEGPLDRPVVYKMDWYMYWLNNKVGGKQEGTARVKLGDARASFYSALTARYAPDRYLIEDGGWHLSSFGGPETIKEKFDGYMDIDMRQLTLKQIEDAIMLGKDLEPRVNRPTGLIPVESTLPSVVISNLKDWQHLIHPDYRE